MFHSTVQLTPENTTAVTLACLALHRLHEQAGFNASSRDPDRQQPVTQDLVNDQWRESHSCMYVLEIQIAHRLLMSDGFRAQVVSER